MAIRGLLLCNTALLVFTTLALVYSYTYTSYDECSAQGVYDGVYGADLVANLTDFRSNLLSHVFKSFDPTEPYPQVSVDAFGMEQDSCTVCK